MKLSKTLADAHKAKKPDFLGRGWAFPIEAVGGVIATTSDAANIKEAIGIILMTPLGQRVMRPTYGSRLTELVFASTNEETRGLAEVYAKDALDLWEPRIIVKEVQANYDLRQEATLLINISYIIRDSDVPDNLVYPFYLHK